MARKRHARNKGNYEQIAINCVLTKYRSPSTTLRKFVLRGQPAV